MRALLTDMPTVASMCAVPVRQMRPEIRAKWPQICACMIAIHRGAPLLLMAALMIDSPLLDASGLISFLYESKKAAMKAMKKNPGRPPPRSGFGGSTESCQGLDRWNWK